MADLPTGTITFLFTDIEGSTRLLATLGDAFHVVLDRHHRILRASVAGNGGQVVSTEGDAFFAVFRQAPAAVTAVLAAQRALSAEHWPNDTQVRVRMGLLTGEGALGGDNYAGLDVHRAARIAAAAHGGQVVLADSTRGLVAHALSDDVSLRDLGEHRLKDLPKPEHLFQLVVADLPADFPALRSLDARPNNLPAPISSFVGRGREIGEVVDMLAGARLLTLTGPGGTGKTRLALRAASELLDEYRHGCWFVPLETLTDPELVPPALANALGVVVPGGRPAIDVLEEWLADRELLLVLDNFEQVTSAGPLIARLLAAAPGVRVLATSRTPLHVYGEAEYPVPPLATLSELRAAATSVEALSQYEAVQLFIERAVAAKPSFSVSNSNAPAVAEICVRLDGLPLAIELAAARVKLLSPEQILARLGHSLSLLASSASDLPERQRTLNGAIDWSYRLLTAEEQRLFARLSVFAGGIELEAAEAVIAPGLELDAFDGLASLVDKSLLRSLELADETRFAMLETLRQYAADLLAADDAERAAAVRRHAAFFFDLARRSEHELTGINQASWLDRLEREDDNLRAAFGAAESVGLLDEALLAAGAVWRFWQQRGRFAEARSIFDRLLALDGAGPAARAKALIGAGGIAYWQTDYEQMAPWYAEAVELYERVGDKAGLADALYNYSFVPLLKEDLEVAAASVNRARDLFTELGDEVNVARAEGVLAMTSYWLGDYEGALPHVEKAVAIFRAKGELLELADVSTNLSVAAALTGDWPKSNGAIKESMAIFAGAGNHVGVAMAIEGLAAMATWAGNAGLAARLFGYAAATTARLGGAAPTFLVRTDSFQTSAAEALGRADYDRLHAEGAAMSQAEAMELAAEYDVPADTPALPAFGPRPES
jgi:predicted ATPase/class 3 adenylate cyclase